MDWMQVQLLKRAGVPELRSIFCAERGRLCMPICMHALTCERITRKSKETRVVPLILSEV